MLGISSTVVEGRNATRLQNEYISCTILNDTGNIVDIKSLKTGHENLWVSGNCIKTGIDDQPWGIKMPLLGSVRDIIKSEKSDKEASLSIISENDSIIQTFTYSILNDSASMKVTVKLLNKTNENVDVPELRPAYAFNVASIAEVSGILSGGGPRYNSMTIPTDEHTFFVGSEAQWPGDGYWEGHEAGEYDHNPENSQGIIWIRPEWFAVLDRNEKEGFAVRFLQKPSFVHTIMTGYPSCSVNVEHDFFAGRLCPNEEKSFGMEWKVFKGLERVDFVGSSSIIGIDLCKSLLPDEEQVISVEALSTENKALLNGHLTIESDLTEVNEIIECDFSGVMDKKVWKYKTGPYRDKMDSIWYYVEKKQGDCSRQTPHIDLIVEGKHIQRKYAPSYDNEEVMERIENWIDEAANAVKKEECSREYYAALLAVKRKAERLRYRNIDPDRMYELCDYARNIKEYGMAGRECMLFDRQEISSIAAAEPVKKFLREARENIASLTDPDFILGKPGRKIYPKSNVMAENAAWAAMLYAACNDDMCGKAAVRILIAFASDHKKYIMTGAGNMLHMSINAVQLIVAYDLTRNLMSLEEEVDILSYFIWLGDFIEKFVNAKGDNDEIHEGGCLAWISGRFPYIPVSERRMMRAYSVLTRQMNVINDDGGWPESPNYAKQVIEAYLNHVVLFEKLGRSIAHEFGGHSIRMALDWLIRILTPSYHIPKLGDGIVQRPNPGIFLLGAYIYKGGRYLQMALDLLECDNSVKISSMACLCYPTDILPADFRNEESDILPHTGYLILRGGSGSDASFLISDFGPYKPGHGHFDKLSFELYAFGENLIGDTGYTFRGTEHHNLIVVDGKQQGKIKGKLAAFETNNGSDLAVIQAEISDGVMHSRTIFNQKGKFYLIHDAVYSKDIHEYSWRVHFDGIAEKTGDFAVYKAPMGASLALYMAGPAPLILGKGETIVYSEETGLSSRPVTRAMVDTRAADMSFTCLLVPFKGKMPEIGLYTENAKDKTFVRVKLDDNSYNIEI